MGSWGSLTINGVEVAAFKSRLHFDTVLLFTRDDMQVAEESFRFVSTAGRARTLMDARGIDLPACKRWYDPFRQHEHVGYDRDARAFFAVDNPIDFPRFLENLRLAFGEDPGDEDRRASVDATTEMPRVLGIPSQDSIDYDALFDHEALFYFDDIAGCVFYRCVLEVVPDEASVELDYTDLVDGGYYDEEHPEQVYDELLGHMLARIELDYRIYGFVLEDNPSLTERLRSRLAAFDEDALIDLVLVPLLGRMGFARVQRVAAHGPGELGADVLPFRHTTPFGTLEYYGLQAKAVSIHGSSTKRGNAAEIVSQATKAFKTTFVDTLDNERKRIDKFVVASSRRITTEARRVIEEAAEDEGRRVIFLDADRLLELVRQHGLTQFVLFSGR